MCNVKFLVINLCNQGKTLCSPCIYHSSTLIAANQRRCVIYTICCIYSNCFLVVNSCSIRSMCRIYNGNKLRNKITSCWFLLRIHFSHLSVGVPYLFSFFLKENIRIYSCIFIFHFCAVILCPGQFS